MISQGSIHPPCVHRFVTFIAGGMYSGFEDCERFSETVISKPLCGALYLPEIIVREGLQILAQGKGRGWSKRLRRNQHLKSCWIEFESLFFFLVMLS